MKRNITITTSVLLLGTAIACKDTFLEKKPYGAVTFETLSQSQTGADAILISAYSLLDGFSSWDNGNPWGSAASNWVYGSIKGGDAYKGSEANDQPDITPFERHEETPLNPYVEAKWNTYYDGIARANQAINAYDAIAGLPAETKNLRVAEGRFLRAFYHYELKRVFNMVPYIDDKTTEFRVPNDKDIWPNIQADLQFAVQNLPTRQSEPGRATKGAAQALLGITYMWQKNYQAAKAQFDAVIASGVYKLSPTYHENFNADFRNTSESILEVQQAVNIGTDDQGNIGDVLNYTHSAGPGGCCGFHQPSQNLVNAFKTDANGLPLIADYNKEGDDVKNDQGITSDQPFTPDTRTLDPRLDWTVGRRGIPYFDWGKHPGASWIRLQAYGGPFSPKKNSYYKRQEGTLTSASGWTKGYNANNVKLIRYADVLLMAAEAEVELNNLTKAREYVNLVRARAANPAGFVKQYKDDAKPELGDSDKPAANYLIKEYPAAHPAFATQAAAREAVRFERRLELGMEGHRFFDLVRWGVAERVLNDYLNVESKKRSYLANARFTPNKSEYRPIPRRAIDRSAKDGAATIKQNPGYQ